MNRTMRYASRPMADVAPWQKEVRSSLQHLLTLDDLVSAREQIALDPVTISTEQKAGH